MATRRQKLIAALEARGARRVEAPTRRFVVYTHPFDKGLFYYIGESGALRIGATASSSISFTDSPRVYLPLIAEGEAALKRGLK